MMVVYNKVHIDLVILYGVVTSLQCCSV